MWSRDQRGNIKAVVSHESALDYHDLGDVMPAKLHITVPKKFRKQAPDTCVLHYNDLPEEDIESHEGFLVTTPVRTIKDVAEGDLSPEYLTKALHDAVKRGIVRTKQFEQNGLSTAGKQRLNEALKVLELEAG
jgi:predicted transcriptional regulator of viral defense system